jgi:hypothetical protein
MMLLLACNVIALFSIIGGIHRWIGWVSGLMYKAMHNTIVI